MIDWHCHILPGLDDGARNIQQSLAMASALAAAGFSTIYCTPHRIPGCYEADNTLVRRSVNELQQRLQGRGIVLNLQPGCEYSLDEYLLDSLKDPLTLGASQLILVEILPQITADTVRDVLYNVVRSGLTPVIAHPERCHLFEPSAPGSDSPNLLQSFKQFLGGGRSSRKAENLTDVPLPPLLDYLRDLGCFFQGNLGSFKGFYGPRVQRAAMRLKGLGLYDRYGSDLHSPEQAKLVL